MHQKEATYLFESSRKHKYSDRGIRRILERYAAAAGITRPLSPHKWRHFLFTWLKAQGIDDALIQPYSGHESRQSLEIYSRLSLAEAQPVYEQIIGRFPIQLSSQIFLMPRVKDLREKSEGYFAAGDSNLNSTPKSRETAFLKG